MPSEPIPGMQWLVPKLLKDLTESKMWPIKLCGVKHQDTLRDFQALLYIYIFDLKKHIYIIYYIYLVFSSITTIAYMKPHPTPSTSSTTDRPDN